MEAHLTGYVTAYGQGELEIIYEYLLKKVLVKSIPVAPQQIDREVDLVLALAECLRGLGSRGPGRSLHL